MIQNESLAAKALAIAATEVGQKEATGRNDGPFVLMLQRWLANGSRWMDGQPWCACFATWCIYQAAAALSVTPLIPKDGSSSDLYQVSRTKNLWLSRPIPHCIGLLRGDGGSPGKTHHHTFMVESVDLANGLVHSIDGNWSNAVCRTTHLISQCDFMVIA